MAQQIRPWRIPALLAISTLAGLLIALTGGQQPWSAISWCLLSVPLAAGAAGYVLGRGKRKGISE